MKVEELVEVGRSSELVEAEVGGPEHVLHFLGLRVLAARVVLGVEGVHQVEPHRWPALHLRRLLELEIVVEVEAVVEGDVVEELSDVVSCEAAHHCLDDEEESVGLEPSQQLVVQVEGLAQFLDGEEEGLDLRPFTQGLGDVGDVLAVLVVAVEDPDVDDLVVVPRAQRQLYAQKLVLGDEDILDAQLRPPRLQLPVDLIEDLLEVDVAAADRDQVDIDVRVGRPQSRRERPHQFRSQVVFLCDFADDSEERLHHRPGLPMLLLRQRSKLADFLREDFEIGPAFVDLVQQFVLPAAQQLGIFLGGEGIVVGVLLVVELAEVDLVGADVGLQFEQFGNGVAYLGLLVDGSQRLLVELVCLFSCRLLPFEQAANTESFGDIKAFLFSSF